MKKKSNINKFIPVNKPLITYKNAKDVYKTLKSGWVSSDGPQVSEFEKKLSRKIGLKYGIAVSNGTAALEIALKSLNLKKDDEVIIPNFTIVSTLLAVIRNELVPVLIDCKIDDWNMQLDEIKKKITKKTKCIIATHIYGFPCEIEKIVNFGKKNKIFVLEDAAEMLGHKNFKGKYYGSFGNISIFSFYANKHITTGEGGMILTNDFNLANKCRSYRNLCFGYGHERFQHIGVGWNYRISNIQASLGLSQLKELDKIIIKKKKVGKIYYNFLKNCKKIYIQPPKKNSSQNVYWVVGIINKSNIDTRKIMNKLHAKGIQTRPFFTPMSKQKVFKKIFKKKIKLINSEKIYRKGFYLPSSINLKFNEIKFICDVLKKIIKD